MDVRCSEKFVKIKIFFENCEGLRVELYVRFLRNMAMRKKLKEETVLKVKPLRNMKYFLLHVSFEKIRFKKKISFGVDIEES